VEWKKKLLSSLDSVGNALLAALATIAATAVTSWAAGASTVILATVAGSTAFLVLSAAVARRAFLSHIRRRAIREYLFDPDLGPSRFLPVGPTTTGTPVGNILSKRSLHVPQHWHHLADPNQLETADLVEVATSVLAQGGKVLILGEPGIGKSLTISRVFESLSKEYAEYPKEKALPVLVHLGDVGLLEGSAQDNTVGLFAAAARLLKLPLSEVDRMANDQSLVTLLDGLDEAVDITGPSSVRMLLSSKSFDTSRVVTARRDFFDLYAATPEMEDNFTLIAELDRLSFGAAISDFVVAYCQEFQRGDATEIIQAITISAELQDLTARPLTLWMTVDVLADPPSGAPVQVRTLTSLYERYTEKWLQREAVRPGSRIERADDKRALVRIAARAMFQRGTALGGTARSTTELAVSRDQLADALSARSAGRLVADVVGRLSLHSALDELCLRTFLVRGGSAEGYRFAHKSFFEYFIALDLWECVGRENRLEVAEDYFARPLSDPVVYFFREMLAASKRRPSERRIISQNMLEILSRRNSIDSRSETVRQHVGNLLAGVADKYTADLLADHIDQEPSEFVRRGITVGLALQQDRADLLEGYMERLREVDSDAVAIQIGYTRIYHGDQEWTGSWVDDGTPEVTRTVDVQIDRLLSSRNRSLSERIWPLTMFTLRKLLEDGRGWPSINGNNARRDRLISFLSVAQPERGRTFEEERLSLLTILVAS
jgi:hypothetical protein